MNAARTGWLPAIVLLCAAAECQAADPWAGEDFTFRLLLGSLDGNENSRVLRDDGHHYTVGVSASSPIAWDRRLEANLEIWVNERGYPGTTTSTGAATDTLTYQATVLTYGFRVHPLTAVRPYALATVGFQANRLDTQTLGADSTGVKEETLVPTAQLGLGIEWQVGRELFSLDWRHWYAKGDFTKFGAHGLDLGGNFVGIGLGHRW